MKINDLGKDPFLSVISEAGIRDWFTDSSGDREFKDYKEGLKKDYLRWANLTQGAKGVDAEQNVGLIKQWLSTQYGIGNNELSGLGGEEQPATEPATAEPTQATAQATAEPTTAEPAKTEPTQAQAAPAKDTAQADKIKANIAANQQARQGGGNSMDLNKWYQDYQAEQNPQNKLNLVKELVNRVADYGPQDVESMKAILKKIRDPQNTPFINAALQKMSAGKDMAVNPQGNAKPQAKPAPQQPAGPTASAQADQGKPGFMQSKLKGVQRPAAPAFTKQTVNNSVMYHVNAIVEALGYSMDQLGYAVIKESATQSTIYNKAMLTESQLMELDVPREPGTIGKVAGAVGGAIGAAKGAWQGAKDAFSGQKAAGQQSTRAHVAGNDLGASGDAQAKQGTGQAGQPAGTAGGLGGGDVWDKVTRLMYQTGRLETNPRNNMANKIGNFMLKGTGYQYDNTKGMARGGYSPSGNAPAGGSAPASTQAGAPGSTAQKLAAMGKGETPAQATPAQATEPAQAQGAAQPTQNTQAQPAQAGQEQPADQGQGEVTGTLNAGQLAKMLPGIDSASIARGIADLKNGKQVAPKQKQAFGDAMVALLKADPATTAQVMNSLNKISAQGGNGTSYTVGGKQATSGFDAKGNATSESVQQRRARRLAEQIFKGLVK